MEALDNQVGGDHYRISPMQPVELFFPTSLPFMEGCVVKYVCRYEKKNGLEDLQKARHFIDLIRHFRNKESSIFKNTLWFISGYINYWRRRKIVNEFCTKNNLNEFQRIAIEYSCWHSNVGHLQAIYSCIQSLEHLLKVRKPNDNI